MNNEEPKWKQELREDLAGKYGEPFANRAMQHLDFVGGYTGYGAPNHMSMVLINALAEQLAQAKKE